MPGIWVQKITTRQPTDDMIEVAIVSLEEALKADGEPVTEGSAEFERFPLDPPVVAEADGPAGAEDPAAAIEVAGLSTTAGAGIAAQDRSSVNSSSMNDVSAGAAGSAGGAGATGSVGGAALSPDEAAGRL
jgi:hypothetical protein